MTSAIRRISARIIIPFYPETTEEQANVIQLLRIVVFYASISVVRSLTTVSANVQKTLPGTISQFFPFFAINVSVRLLEPGHLEAWSHLNDF